MIVNYPVFVFNIIALSIFSCNYSLSSLANFIKSLNFPSIFSYLALSIFIILSILDLFYSFQQTLCCISFRLLFFSQSISHSLSSNFPNLTFFFSMHHPLFLSCCLPSHLPASLLTLASHTDLHNVRSCCSISFFPPAAINFSPSASSFLTQAVEPIIAKLSLPPLLCPIFPAAPILARCYSWFFSSHHLTVLMPFRCYRSINWWFLWNGPLPFWEVRQTYFW